MPKHNNPLHLNSLIKGEPAALVAGGAGFLGSYLCKKLLETCRVICLDNLASGGRENIAECLKSEKFTFIEYDIKKPLADLLRKKVNYIFHVAGVEEANVKNKATLEDLLINTTGQEIYWKKPVQIKQNFFLFLRCHMSSQVWKLLMRPKPDFFQRI